MPVKQKILIVDDDPTILKFLTELLSSDYELRSYESGEAALDNIVRFKPDIALLDIMLKGMNGYEICRRIRENPELSKVNIIFLSAKVALYEKLKGYKVGGDDYITKPFEVDELLAKIRVYTRLHHYDDGNQLLNDIFDEKQLEIFYKIQRKITDVMYIKSDSPYCNVISIGKSRQTDRLRITIQALEDYFGGDKLVRVHRSYLVNPKRITAVNRQKNNELKIMLKGSQGAAIAIPVGRSYHERVKVLVLTLFNN